MFLQLWVNGVLLYIGEEKNSQNFILRLEMHSVGTVIYYTQTQMKISHLPTHAKVYPVWHCLAQLSPMS